MRRFRRSLNTGGRGTEFAASAVPGLGAGAAMRRIGGGVSGADVVAASAGRQTLVVDRRELPVTSLEVRSTMHDPQGIVGMDVLGGTVLAVAADPARPVRWQTSHAHPWVIALPTGTISHQTLPGGSTTGSPESA